MKKVSGFKYFLYVCFSTTGRTNRAWWWLYIFLSNIFYWGLPILIVGMSGSHAPEFDFFFYHTLAAIVLGYSSIVVTIKRFRDTNRTGWNMLFGLIPFFGVLYIIIVCGFFKGTEGDNTYGEPSYLIGDWGSYTESNQEEINK